MDTETEKEHNRTDIKLLRRIVQTIRAIKHCIKNHHIISQYHRILVCKTVKYIKKYAPEFYIQSSMYDSTIWMTELTRTQSMKTKVFPNKTQRNAVLAIVEPFEEDCLTHLPSNTLFLPLNSKDAVFELMNHLRDVYSCKIGQCMFGNHVLKVELSGNDEENKETKAFIIDQIAEYELQCSVEFRDKPMLTEFKCDCNCPLSCPYTTSCPYGHPRLPTNL